MKPKTTQEWISEMKPKTTMKMRIRNLRKSLDTVNQYLKMETTSQKLRNVIIYTIIEHQNTPI